MVDEPDRLKRCLVGSSSSPPPPSPRPICAPLSDEFDEVGAEIDRALDHFNVPQPERQEFVAAIVARKDK